MRKKGKNMRLTIIEVNFIDFLVFSSWILNNWAFSLIFFNSS